MGVVLAKVLDIDGEYRNNPDFPVAVVREDGGDGTEKSIIVDPVFNHSVVSNLYGRIMTLVEATTDSHKLKPVKDLISKELNAWSDEVYMSARELATGGNSSNNIYTRNK